jgi:Flp pilus assembly pilin Flp
MNTQVISTEYADNWPLQPWAAAVRAAAVADTDTEADVEVAAWKPSSGSFEFQSARKQRDRGASAVEWVVITAIVVAIVGVVGGIIFKAVQGKANKTSDTISNQDVTSGSTP